MDLMSEQRDLLHDLRDARRDFREDHKEHRQRKGQWMQDYVYGETDRADIHEQIDDSHAAIYSAQQKMQRQLWDLLESYDEEQREQLLNNIALKRTSERQKMRSIKWLLG